MIHTRVLKMQGMSYCMVQSILRCQCHNVCVEKLRLDGLNMCMQSRLMSSYSRRIKNYKHSSAEGSKKSEAAQNFDNMLKSLSATADTEKEQTSNSRQTNLREKLALEVNLTGVPAVIRVLKPSLFMKRYYSFSGVLHYPTPFEWYCEIEQPVETSSSYDNVCFKLQAPYNLVTGFCAKQALLKVCEMTKEGQSVSSVIQNEVVVDEIFAVVTQQVDTLTKEDIVKLILYRYRLKDFSKTLYNKVFSVFMVLINTDTYTASELFDILCSLRKVNTDAFTSNEKMEFEKLIRNMWNYFSSRPNLISLSMLADLYESAPADHVKIFPVLNTILIENIAEMNVYDVFMIFKEIHTRADSKAVVIFVNSWLESNFHRLPVNDMETLLSNCVEKQCVCDLLLKILPEYIVLEFVMKGLNTRLIVLMLSYCLLGRHFDKTVLETACNHYIEDTKGYSTEELSCLLKAIGTFNYGPYRQQAFFSKVELYLMENFYNIDVLTLLEMFVHLIYTDKVAVNFKPYIFAPLFLGIVNEMPKADRVRGLKYLRIINCAFTARGFKPRNILHSDPRAEPVSEDKGIFDFIQPVFAKNLVDDALIEVKDTPTYSGKYLKVQCSPLKDYKDKYFKNKFAFLVLTEESYVRNDKTRLLGHEATNIRLLQEYGLNVYSTDIDNINELKMNNKFEGFVQSLCLQIFNTTVETVLDSDDEAIDDPDRTSGNNVVEDSEKKSLDSEEESLDNEEESLDNEDIYDL